MGITQKKLDDLKSSIPSKIEELQQEIREHTAQCLVLQDRIREKHDKIKKLKLKLDLIENDEDFK